MLVEVHSPRPSTGGSKVSGWGRPACSPLATRGTTGLLKTTVMAASVPMADAPSSGLVWLTASGPVVCTVNSTGSGSVWPLSEVAVSARDTPVSYTHLDVYKRQSSGRLYLFAQAQR